jgi:hypothetical protein
VRVLVTALSALSIAVAAGGCGGSSRHPLLYLTRGVSIVTVDPTHPDRQTTVLAHAPDNQRLAVTDRYLFWVGFSQHTNSLDDGLVWRADIDGQNAHVIARQANPTGGIAVAGDRVYWLDSEGISSADFDGGGIRRPLVRLPKGPGTGDAPTAFDLVADATHLFYGDCARGIGRVDADGTDLRPGFIPGPCPFGLGVGGGYVYWAETAEGIGRARVDGTGVQEHWAATNTQDGPLDVAADEHHVYWSEQSDAASGAVTRIHRLDADGSGDETILRGPDWGDSLVLG